VRSKSHGRRLGWVHEKQGTTRGLVADDRLAELDRTGEETCTAKPTHLSFCSGLMEGEMWFASMVLIAISLVLVVINLVQWRRSKKNAEGSTGDRA
jgi:hypothetical protein